MRRPVAALILQGSLALLAACGKPAGQGNPPGVEVVSAAPAATTDAEKKAALATLPAAYRTADLDNGQAKFALCKSCHTVIAGGADMVGPNLYGVFGRKAGTKPGFAYSDGLKASEIVWDAVKIDQWIANPRALVPATKMTYLGMANPKDRVDLIAYLKVASTAPGG